MYLSRRASKDILRHTLAQATTMGLAFATGILIVRELTKTDYAYYSICVSLIAAFGLLGEAGVGSVIMAKGGRLPVNSLKFLYLTTSAQKYRKVLSAPLLVVGGAMTSLILLMAGATALYTFTLTVIAMASVWLTLSTGIYQNLHRLNMGWAFLRRLTLLSACFRLLVFASISYTTGLDAATALIIGLLAYWLVFVFQRGQARKILHKSGDESRRYFSHFIRSAKRIVPMTILLVASEQAVIVILAANGATSSIAEISALSRFGVVFTLLNLVFADMGAPYIARLNMQAKGVAKRIAALALAYLVVALLIGGMLRLLAPQLLSILGQGYSHLVGPFTIICAGQILLNLGYSVGYLVQAKGWTRWSWSYGIFALIWVICGLLLLDLNTTYGAALLMATQTIPNLLTQSVRILVGVRDSQK